MTTSAILEHRAGQGEPGDEDDPQSGNAWRGLPSVEAHDCAEHGHEDLRTHLWFCGVCGKQIKPKD